MKGNYIRYDKDVNIESAIEALRIYIPTEKGYVNYNFLRSVSDAKFLNTWRLGQVFAYNDAFQKEYDLTTHGAEWDMAIRLKYRDDFIGGYAHGDEYFTKMSLKIDGKDADISSFTEMTPFEELEIEVSSYGTDPDDHKTKVLNHIKHYNIGAQGIFLTQRVEWLGDYILDSSFLAMMPPPKSLTETVSINGRKGEEVKIGMRVKHCKKAVVYGEKSKIYYEMAIPEYPYYDEGAEFHITDNGNGGYNKMYFFVTPNKGDVKIKSGDVWNSVTQYSIKSLL